MSATVERAVAKRCVPNYTYRADTYCSRCILDAYATREGFTPEPLLRELPTEVALDRLAATCVPGVDRDSERSFDSDDFPKRGFNTLSPPRIGDRCAGCELPLVLVQHPDTCEWSSPDFSSNHLGTWTNDDGWTALRLDMWHHGPDPKNDFRTLIAYMFCADYGLVFHGTDYSPAPSLGIDSNEAAGGLLGFLGCKPGDVEEDYFKSYSERQLAFAREHGDDITIWANDLEGESQ